MAYNEKQSLVAPSWKPTQSLINLMVLKAIAIIGSDAMPCKNRWKLHIHLAVPEIHYELNDMVKNVIKNWQNNFMLIVSPV